MRPKVYIGQFLAEKKSYLPILYPNLGRQHKPGRLFLDKAYDVLGKPVVDIVTDPALCDFFLLPYDFFNVEKFDKYLREFGALARKHNKKILIFDFSDFDKQIDIPNSIQFRVSLYESSKREGEIVMPPFVENLTSFPERNKSLKPTVGFVGYVHFSLPSYFKLGARKHGIYFRRKALDELEGVSEITTKVIRRLGYSGHRDTIGMDPELARKQYLENINDSDLILAPKGYGNYSLRLYETLALGRIPILIDTDCVLPLEDELDYNKFILRVDYKNMDRLPNVIRNWWSRISNEEFIEMQKLASEAFTQHLRLDRYLPRAFEKYCRK
ncbi:MAG TPA: exostosin family protein [Candidatus Paceibacterota bacterium]